MLMTAMLRPGDVRSLKRAAAIATPMALVGIAVALGYHLERNGVAYALAAAIVMIALIYGVASCLRDVVSEATSPQPARRSGGVRWPNGRSPAVVAGGI